MGRRWQLRQAALYRRQRAFVAQQPVPGEFLGNQQAAARTGHAHPLAQRRVHRPVSGRAGIVQRELEHQFVARHIPAHGRVIARRRALTCEAGAAVDEGRQIGAFQALLGQDEFQVVVKAGADEAGQLGAAQRHAHKAGADDFARQQLQVARSKGMALALDAQGFGSSGGHAGLWRKMLT
ncbi:hypothetical protein D3C78_1433990 [compost metagenome]